MPTVTLVSPAQMLAMAGDTRIVYVDETHDNLAFHLLLSIDGESLKNNSDLIYALQMKHHGLSNNCSVNL